MWALAALVARINDPAASLLAWLLAWAALSLLVVVALYVSTAFGGQWGAVLRGHRWPWMQPVFWPFRAVSVGMHLASRAIGRTEPASEIAPGVWVGPRPMGSEVARLRAAGVWAVIDLAAELPVQKAFREDGWRLMELPLLDRTPPDDADLDRAVAFALGERAAGRAVLVHCSFGRGRSGTVACAVGVAAGLLPEDAAAAVSQAVAGRASVRVKADQLAALARFVARRRGR